MPRTAVHVAGTALLITLCTLGLGAQAVHAGHHEHREGSGHGEHKAHKAKDPAAYAARLTEDLGLDEDQSAKVAAIIEEYHAKVQGTNDQIEALFEQLKPLKEQVKEQKQAKYDAIKAVLTLEQKVKFLESKGKNRGYKKHGSDCSCELCSLKRAESSKSEEE